MLNDALAVSHFVPPYGDGFHNLLLSRTWNELCTHFSFLMALMVDAPRFP